MNHLPESTIRVHVDPTNPGQFFACCGLLELAHRLWGGAEGWFDRHGPHFSFRPAQGVPEYSASTFINAIARCRLTSTMTKVQLQRRDQLSTITKKHSEANASFEAEKKVLDALWREAPIVLHGPFDLRLDWFIDDRSGGDTFKTWAGQQSVADIASGVKALIETGNWNMTPPKEWLSQTTNSDCIPFNFDSALGGAGSDRDIGFSFDPLKSTGLRMRTRPLIEFAAFIGLQRFRPKRVEKENRYQFSTWFDPLVPQVASVATCGLLQSPNSRTFEFRLLYRTRYLKSFLPATELTGGYR